MLRRLGRLKVTAKEIEAARKRLWLALNFLPSNAAKQANADLEALCAAARENGVMRELCEAYVNYEAHTHEDACQETIDALEAYRTMKGVERERP